VILSLAFRHGIWQAVGIVWMSKAVAGETIVGQVVVEHVGIGEIFVIAGQSNSANHGEEKQKVNIQKVFYFLMENLGGLLMTTAAGR
jgi:hypothetical protein